MYKYSQGQAELLGQLKEQISFLERSAAVFDSGFEEEAKRLALTLRILLYDKSNSRSLLTQLNRKNIRLYNSALPYRPQNPIPYSGLTMIKISSSDGGKYVAPLDSGSPSRSTTSKLPFNIWWDGVFIRNDKNGNTFNRKQMTLFVADTDGGAHIDPNLNVAYASLSRFNSMGWKFLRQDTSYDFKNSPVLPTIRQITHEVLKTLKDEFPDIFFSVS